MSLELQLISPIAFVKDKDVYRGFLGTLLQDLDNDILFVPEKMRVLSIVLISAMKHKNIEEYIKPDDLLAYLSLVKRKFENLAISTENINIQEAIECLNDILFLMRFIGVQANLEEYV